MSRWLRERAVLIAGGMFVLSVVLNVVLYLKLGSDEASKLGDSLGIASALFSGIALLGVAFSIRDLSDNQIQQQRQIDALAAIARALTDPVVVARVEVHNDTEYELIVENLGKSPAYDVRFSVDPKEGLSPLDLPDMNLADHAVIRNGFSVMAPGQRVAIWVAEGGHLREKRESGADHVSEFTIEITYALRHSEQERAPSERRAYFYSFNFTNQSHAIQPRGEIASELHRIYKMFDKAFANESSDRKRFRVETTSKG